MNLDTIVSETHGQRSDTAVSKMTQLSFEASLDFDKAKVENIALRGLCHDLLWLAIFLKESLNINKLDACITFQIHGNTFNLRTNFCRFLVRQIL